MNLMKKILFNFLKDRLLFICVYLISTICIVTFYNLINEHIEIIYPLLMSILLFMIFLVIDFLKYYEMNKGIELLLLGKSLELKPKTEEQKSFYELLQKIKKEHTQQYNQLKNHYDESIYFVSHFLHHLKTPVSVIQLILENESNACPELTQKIEKENKRIYSSIEQGLTMLRVDHFQKDVEIHSIDLLSTLRKLMNGHKKECIYYSIYPSIESECDEVKIATDSKWNELLLNQIISNAIKYSSYKKGKKNLVFKVVQEPKCTTLSIIDEGVGIPPYDIDRIFEPFFTGENGRKYSNSTGIGLYICKKISEKLGHKISITLNGKGTIVHIKYFTAHNLTDL